MQQKQPQRKQGIKIYLTSIILYSINGYRIENGKTSIKYSIQRKLFQDTCENNIKLQGFIWCSLFLGPRDEYIFSYALHSMISVSWTLYSVQSWFGSSAVYSCLFCFSQRLEQKKVVTLWVMHESSSGPWDRSDFNNTFPSRSCHVTALHVIWFENTEPFFIFWTSGVLFRLYEIDKSLLWTIAVPMCCRVLVLVHSNIFFILTIKNIFLGGVGEQKSNNDNS